MNDAKSMLMMYSYAAMKAKSETKAKGDSKQVKTKAKAAKAAKDDSKQVKTKRRGEENDKGTERADSTITKE